MPTPGPSPEGDTELQPYWDRVSQTYAADDPLAAVLYPGAPGWLNRFFAGLQWSAVTRVLEDIEVEGARALDVGCGFGRWTRWLAEHGAHAIGVDPTEGMLEAARRASPDTVEYRRMSATALDFPDDHFDLVVSITVIQHLQPFEQEAAIAELGRVLRPGGTAVLLDLIDVGDRGSVVYPRPASDWIRSYEADGLRVERWEGQEYVPLIRAFRSIAELVGRWLGIGSDQREGASLLERTHGRGAFSVAYAALWVVVQLSKALEPPSRWLLPPDRARHACFVLRKKEDYNPSDDQASARS